MKPGHLSRRQGRDAKSWPVLLLLLIVVLVPAVGVLWFMTQAMRNERLAVRQKLIDVYESQLHGLREELQLFWEARSTELDAKDPNLPGSRVFAERVRAGLADSVVIYDVTGRPSYPAPPRGPEAGLRLPRSWRLAERLERSGQGAAAAERYGEIAEGAADRNLAAVALQAQVRCLVQAGRVPAAIAILAGELSRPEYGSAVDSQGRLIAPSAQLRALQLIEDPSVSTFRQIAEALAARLVDYDDPALPSAQRLFLMKQLRELDATLAADARAFDTLAAEQLAARYLASDPPPPPTTSLQPSPLPEVWHLASPGGTVVALFGQRRLVTDLAPVFARHRPPQEAAVELLSPGEEPVDPILVSLPAGGFLPGWQLVLYPEDQSLFATAASQRIAAYRLTGVLVTGAILILAVLVARAVERRLRLSRLKNDLLATVSHELKTPLASMRLLVDTLLETGHQDSRRVSEYLQLIAKENVRLSRLVESFLTFSRMEQNRQSFERKQVSAGAVIEAAADSMAERFRASGCRFEVQIASDLPLLLGDHDALVTALLNLLDNAYKYSDEEPHILLRGYRDDSHVCFAVRDDGIGLSGREAGKIFDRFYQVDQSLSRRESGCGLGLAIVDHIVKAHGGSVDVDSKPGEGSTFTVRLPVVSNERQGREELT